MGITTNSLKRHECLAPVYGNVDDGANRQPAPNVGEQQPACADLGRSPCPNPSYLLSPSISRDDGALHRNRPNVPLEPQGPPDLLAG